VSLASPIGSAAGGTVNLSTSLSNVAKLAVHRKFVWVVNTNCDGTIMYNDPVYRLPSCRQKMAFFPTSIMTFKYEGGCV
jgi:hypothetical protein